MKLTKKDLLILEAIGTLQLQEIEETKNFKYSFEFEGIEILNPTLCENGMYEVNPMEYYGIAFLNSNFMQLLK